MAASSAARQYGGHGRPRGRRPGYRKRRPLPAISILVLLCIVAIVVWVTAISSTGGKEDAAGCPVPADGSIGKPVASNALNNVQPVAPGQAPLKVLNAADERGAATMVDTVLEQLGFAKAASPSNDPAYQQSPLECHGQIRFGEAGKAAARTLSLVDPCTQLVRDDRADGTVDFVIGQKFDDLRPSEASRKVINQLKAIAAGDAEGPIDQKLLKQARDTSNC